MSMAASWKGRRYVKRFFLILTVFALGASPISSAGAPQSDFTAGAPAQSTDEVVLPVGVRSVVQVSAPANSQLSVDKGSFRGSAEIISDPPKAHYTLMVVPDPQDGPSDLKISRQGATLRTIRVYPVITQVEEWTFESRAPLPDPTSREYTTVTQISVPHAGVFNGIERNKLRKMEISGVRIVIGPGEKQGTYERLMPGGTAPPDLGELDIFAEEVVVSAALRLPGTAVKIYAQTIRFQDTANTTASIDVTPLARPAQTNSTSPGLPGQDAPEMFLYVAQPIPNDGKVRLICRGGPGQQGGPPIGAGKGDDLPTLDRDQRLPCDSIAGIVRNWDRIHKVIHDPLPQGWGADYAASINTVWFKCYDNFEFGNGQWPSDATAGSSGGIGGIGGRGGTIHSSVALPKDTIDVRGGSGATPR